MDGSLLFEALTVMEEKTEKTCLEVANYLRVKHLTSRNVVEKQTATQVVKTHLQYRSNSSQKSEREKRGCKTFSSSLATKDDNSEK